MAMADSEVVLTDENIPPMQDELFKLYSQGFLTDITLSCEDGKNFEAHRVLLAARSQYFYGIVPKLKVEPVIFLKGVKGSHLEKVLKYIYSGSATVSRTQLKSVLEVARSLQVKGLQDLAPTELSRGTNTSFQSHSKFPGSKTSSPIPSKGKDDSYHRLSPQNARDIALQQQQKLYDKISLSKKSPLGKSNANDRNTQYSPSKKSKQPLNKESSSKSFKDDDNGEEIFKFQYQYISDDSDEMDKDDSNDSDFEVSKKNPKDIAEELNSKKKRGRPPKSSDSVSPLKGRKSYAKEDSELEFRTSRKSSKSSTDDDSDNSSDLDQDDSDSESEADSDDNSGSDTDNDDEEEDRRGSSRLSHHSSSQTISAKAESPRHTGKGSSGSRNRKESRNPPSSDNYYDAPPPPNPSPRRGRGRGPSINGKQILAVQCKGKQAELHLSKFGNGTNGKSIKYKGEWMTPEDYELACGIKAKKYLESITTDYGPLKTLTVSGLLKPCPKKCKCNVCMDEETTSPELQNRMKKEEKEFRTPVKSDSSKETDKLPVKKRDGSPLVGSQESENKKRKHDSESDSKNRLSQTQSSHSRQLTSKSSSSRDKAASKSQEQPSSNIKLPSSTGSSPSKLSPSISKTDIISPATLSSTKSISSSLTSAPSVSTSSTFSPSSSKPLTSPSFIAMTPATSLNTLAPLTTTVSSSLPSSAPFASKFTSSSLMTSSQQTYTSHNSSMTSLNTTSSSSVSSHTTSFHQSTASQNSPSSAAQNTVASGHQVKAENRQQQHYSQTSGGSTQSSPSQAQPQLKSSSNVATMGPPGVKPLDPLQMMGNMQQSGHGMMSPHQHHHTSKGHGRVGSVMQVRCKALSALLYVSKYESGSKGKCILVGDEWMTPNEFEEKAGSKAKKYLSSIKCLGRPLRAYVNSGELRGTGPAPSPKPPKINKPKPPQPIAPAPAPGQAGGYGGMAGMSPAHISAASMPQSLTQVAMMGGGPAGQPILLNQNSLAVSLAGQGQTSAMNQQVGTQILQPMTFTFAPMSMQGQQLQHQPLQHQQIHGTTVAQQLHSSADYILQHK